MDQYQCRGKLLRNFQDHWSIRSSQEKVWTNDWSICISPEVGMDQWSLKFLKSFPLHWYWSTDGSSLRNTLTKTLRAKGTLISEPRFSTSCEMRFFPREKGKTVFVEGFSFRMAVFPFSRGKNRISHEVENRGSRISVPLALREGVSSHWSCNRRTLHRSPMSRT